ncbi:plasmid mobilization protein [Hominenteromicrobium sp.]|uniref:plasmid mobilization protein n=1 Tax=Hominenteromicrobium sp. TaxID=3073581 RepID=UPI003993CBE5
MANRNRPVQVKFRVTPEERALIGRRMEQAGTMNMAAYLRKMAIDGYVVKLELPELRDMISHLRRTSNNFNQIARRVNSTNRIYEDDIREMKGMLEQIWEANNRILEKLAAID